MPSGSPSGNVWICTVLLELAVTSLPFCRRKNTSHSNTGSFSSQWKLILYFESAATHLECEGVHLFSNSDELWIVIIQTLPYPNISIITTGYKEPEEKCITMVRFWQYGNKQNISLQTDFLWPSCLLHFLLNHFPEYFSIWYFIKSATIQSDVIQGP